MYQDERTDEIFYLGDTAIHHAEDPLPGIFPLWIESESLLFLPNSNKHEFPVDQVPGKVLDLREVGIKRGNVYFKSSQATLNTIKAELNSGRILFNRNVLDGDKQIIRIRYTRGKSSD